MIGRYLVHGRLHLFMVHVDYRLFGTGWWMVDALVYGTSWCMVDALVCVYTLITGWGIGWCMVDAWFRFISIGL